MMDVDAASSRALSMVDINMPLPISSDDEDSEVKIIKETENKISHLPLVNSKTYYGFFS
jgi:hypothetical protein